MDMPSYKKPLFGYDLKLALQKARENNIPKDNIQRAIDKGVGATDMNAYEEIVYEGYGPAGVAVTVEVMTDNRNRAAADVRHAFSKQGGNLGESGCVGWMFKSKGVFVIDKEGHDVILTELGKTAVQKFSVSGNMPDDFLFWTIVGDVAASAACQKQFFSETWILFEERHFSSCFSSGASRHQTA